MGSRALASTHSPSTAVVGEEIRERVGMRFVSKFVAHCRIESGFNLTLNLARKPAAAPGFVDHFMGDRFLRRFYEIIVRKSVLLHHRVDGLDPVLQFLLFFHGE